MIIAAFIILLICILLILPVSLDLKYLYLGGSGRMTVRAGILALHVTVFDSAKQEKMKTEESEEAKKDDEKKEDESAKKEKKEKLDFGRMKKILSESLKLLSYLSKRLTVDRLKLHFHIGLEDAAATGIATGAAWAFLYDFVSLCDNKLKLKSHSVNVCPDFREEVFETDIRLVISIRIIFAVILAVKAMKLYLKMKGDNKNE